MIMTADAGQLAGRVGVQSGRLNCSPFSPVGRTVGAVSSVSSESRGERGDRNRPFGRLFARGVCLCREEYDLLL